MILTDRIHGDIIINEPVIIDLISSAPMQRLKQISQDGATHYIQPVFDVTRFEHSIGTWYLAHRKQRPLEEQIACLLHDVPHTAFSHVVDMVMKDERQEYHDRFLEQIVMQSEIPAICARHGIAIESVLDKSKFYMLDNEAPELSFDRWDYFMRDAYVIGILPRMTIAHILEDVVVHEGQLCFRDKRLASLLCINTITTCELVYAGPTSFGSYCLLAGAVSAALEANELTEQQLFGTDDAVMQVLQASTNPVVRHNLERLTVGREFTVADAGDAEFIGKQKARYIDPLVLSGDRLQNVSTIVVSLQTRINQFKKACAHIAVNQIAG